MALARLALTDFRSHAALTIAPAPGLVVLTGENGAGKTNILEAISLFAPGRGLRGAALSDMARSDGPGGFAVAARLLLPLPPAGEGLTKDPLVSSEVETRAPASRLRSMQTGLVERVSTALDTNGSGSPDHAFVNLGTGTLASAPERRQVRINGAAASANALSEWLAIVWLTPAMDRLFTDAASGRRRFLDRLVLALEPGHAVHAARYEAAMRARNRLLADEGAADPAWLTALESAMAEHGAALADARARTVTALADRLADQPEGPFARAALALEGWVPQGDLAAELRAGRARDAAAGRTLAGPHRSDLAVTHLGKGQAAARASTGEQKALLLGIVLAHADLVADRVGRRPLLLLDEVAAHLDPTRRAVLLDRLAAAGGQVWMTGTEAALFADAPAVTQRWVLAGGVVREG